ncbi:hypothetical protein yfred0001_9590 [Yersinia frederiksenii ATCC 33641]|nr:hypothetical protein yfred0001_9590 [Yersinia frederiksenii ATCC 33641]
MKVAATSTGTALAILLGERRGHDRFFCCYMLRFMDIY